MATQGPLSPSTTVDDATVGTVSWTSPNNSQVSDGVFATATSVNGTEITHYLKATNFGFSIPSGATINGIRVGVNYKASVNPGVTDATVKIIKSNGLLGTQNKGTQGAWSTGPGYRYFGSSSDLWGETWAVSDINNSNFGVVSSEHFTVSGAIAYIDSFNIEVTYTASASASISNIQSITNVISLTL